MGRSLSPIVKRELENLDKDTSRRAAMTALNSFVKDLDFKAIPLFIAEVSRKKEAGSLSEESSVSLYEGLVRVHGSKLIPLIDTIMDSIIKTMGSVPGSSFALQQACSKVVTAIARYSIDPNVPEDTKRHVIHSLCGPLLDSLLGSQESLTSGAALCLKALVENDNWRFASYEMVNKVCQSVTGALEESSTQSNAHMGLVQAMAKRNAVAVEPYARLLIRAGFKILDGGSEKANSQKRLSTIQMIKFLIKSLDIWCIQGEIGSVIEEMEKCQSDPMAFVRVAALETLRTARSMVEGKGSKLENGCPGSVTGSNFSRRFLPGSGDQSPASAVSPLSRTFNSLVEYDSLIGSPILSTQDIQYLDNDSRSVDRKFLGRENGGGFVDVSLKDGLFSGSPRSNGVSNGFLERSDSPKIVQSGENHEEEFLGFSRTKLTTRGISRSATSSPVRSRTPIRVENDIYRTPRSHVYSLQDPLNLASTERPPRWSRNQLLSDFERSPVFRCEHRNCDGYGLRNTRSLQDDDDKFHGSNESVSSMEEIPVVNGDIQEPNEVLPKRKAFTMRFPAKLVCGLSLALLAVAAPIWLTSQEQGYYLVPT